mmetsp:Transcript_30580/g.66720  ORF Transcript_30580/g.66720 Transcript_30580/m.66720 type:complete len:205 (+) Transcript_30580:433-1047(+)
MLRRVFASSSLRVSGRSSSSSSLSLSSENCSSVVVGGWITSCPAPGGACGPVPSTRPASCGSFAAGTRSCVIISLFAFTCMMSLDFCSIMPRRMTMFCSVTPSPSASSARDAGQSHSSLEKRDSMPCFSASSVACPLSPFSSYIFILPSVPVSFCSRVLRRLLEDTSPSASSPLRTRSSSCSCSTTSSSRSMSWLSSLAKLKRE